MGGTGSVVHGRRSRNRAGETSLLKLYNRDRCIERLPDIELANDGHSKVRKREEVYDPTAYAPDVDEPMYTF